MIILINTDKTIDGSERLQEYFSEQIAEELDRFQDHISRIEVHISDENGKKDGINDIRCLLEARLEGRKPIAVSDKAGNVEMAVSGAIDKMKASIETILGRMRNY